MMRLSGDKTQMARILIAEDDASMRHFLSSALEKAGHEVFAHADGTEALGALNSGRSYDLLLADIVMPGMDGIELSQRAADLFPDMKIMFITGFAAVALRNGNFGEASGARILSKPFHLKELVGQIQSVLGTAGAPVAMS